MTSVTCERICLGENSSGNHESKDNLKFQEVFTFLSLDS